MKDNTIAQARRWVEQEFPKQSTREEIEGRIRMEKKMVAFSESRGTPYPNSRWAHEELIRRLQAKLETLGGES